MPESENTQSCEEGQSHGCPDSALEVADPGVGWSIAIEQSFLDVLGVCWVRECLQTSWSDACGQLQVGEVRWVVELTYHFFFQLWVGEHSILELGVEHLSHSLLHVFVVEPVGVGGALDLAVSMTFLCHCSLFNILKNKV